MSTATFHAELRSGTRQKLQTAAGLPSVDWEGLEFTPVKGTPWLTENIRPISSTVIGTGSGGYIAHKVTANFTLHYPLNKGTADIEAMAGTLMQLFHPGTSVTYGTTAAIVQQAERMALLQESDWINLTVVVTMIGHTTN